MQGDKLTQKLNAEINQFLSNTTPTVEGKEVLTAYTIVLLP